MSMENLVETDVSWAYILGKLSVIDRELKATKRHLCTLENEKRSLLIMLEDRTKLSKVQIQMFSWSYVNIVVDMSSGEEEYVESDYKKNFKIIPFTPKIPTPIIEQAN